MMYVAVDNRKNIIAIHPDINVVREFVSSQDESLKIMKGKSKKIPESILSDKYLVKYDSGYIPMEYSSVAGNLDSGVIYELSSAIDVIANIAFNSENISNKDYKCLMRTINILAKEIEDITSDTIPVNLMKEIHDMDESFKNNIFKE